MKQHEIIRNKSEVMLRCWDNTKVDEQVTYMDLKYLKYASIN